MTKLDTETKNDLIASLNDAKQIKKMIYLNDLNENRERLDYHIDNILHWLRKYVDDNDNIQEL